MLPRRILLIDDHDAELRQVEQALRHAGFEVAVCGATGVSLADIEADPPAAIALDTEGSGLELLRILKAAPTLASTRVLALGRTDDAELVTRAFDAGADDFVRRPVPISELVARMRSQLRMRQYVTSIAAKERDAQVMLELTQALASSLDIRDILLTVVRRIAEVVSVDRVSIILAPEPEDREVGYVVVASDDDELSNLRLDLAKYPEIQQVLETREPLTIRDVRTHPLFHALREVTGSIAVSSMSLFPIVWQDQVMGVVFLRADEHRADLSDREVHFCRIVTNATAVALRNAKVMQSLRDHTQKVTFARFEAERRVRGLKRYADLFASVADGIAVFDVDGRLLFANPRAYEIVGHTEESLRGVNLRYLVHPDDKQKSKNLWDGFPRGVYPRGEDLRIVRGDGCTIVCSVSFAPMLDGEGAVLLSFRDVTEHRHTENELIRTKEFLESLIDASVDGIVAANLRGTIILFNKGAERIYGYRAEDVVGRLHVTQLYPGDGARQVMRLLRSPTHGGIGRLENMRMDVLGNGGEMIPITISASIIYEHGLPAATFAIFTDLREKLRAEERLALAQEKLALTEKQALLAELAGAAAHELNQPLTSVMGYAELLKRKLFPESAEHHAACSILQEAERMADIVRKIGKITRYETKSYVGRQKILDLDKASEAGKPERLGE